MNYFVIADKDTGVIQHCAITTHPKDVFNGLMDEEDYPLSMNPMPKNLFYAVIDEDVLLTSLASKEITRCPNTKQGSLDYLCIDTKEGKFLHPDRIREELKVFPNEDSKVKSLHKKPKIQIRSCRCRIDLITGDPVEDMENYEEVVLDSWNQSEMEMEKEKQRKQNGGLDDKSLLKLKSEIETELSKKFQLKK